MTEDTSAPIQEHEEIQTESDPRPKVATKGTEESSPQSSVHQTFLQKCFSFPVLLGTLLVAADAAIMLPQFRIGPDTWWHIKLGASILTTGHWLKSDIYSFTAYHQNPLSFEWIGEVVIALAYRAGHLIGLQVLLLILTSAILLLLYYYAWLRCKNSKAAFAGTLLALPLAIINFTLRPQLLGFIFLLVVLVCLERFRLGEQKSLWILPLIFLIWVNTHGTFALGFFALGIYWLCGLKEFNLGGLKVVRWTERQRIHMELICMLCLLVLPITPFGTQPAMFPVDKALHFPLSAKYISEWLPLNFSWWQAKLALFLLMAFLLVQIVYRLSYRLEELFLFLFFFYATCVHMRFMIFFAMMTAPLVAAFLARSMPAYEPAKDKYVLNLALILIIGAGFVWKRPSEAKLAKHVAKAYPVSAVEYLRKNPVPRPMFNFYGYGGYLLWAMGPKHKVFIDGRGDFYELAGVLRDYMDIADIHPDALPLLRTFRIRSCLIPRKAPLAVLLQASPKWKEIYQDGLCAIFVRGPYHPVLGQAGSAKASRVKPGQAEGN